MPYAVCRLPAGTSVARRGLSSLGDVLRDVEHTAASIGEIVLLLTLLDGYPFGVHGRAGCGCRRGTHGDGSANHRGRRDRTIVAVPAGVHVDAPVDVDAVGATASDVAGTGIRATAAAATSAGRGASAPTAAAATTTSTASTAPATPGISVRGHGEAGQNEGGHRRRKQLAE
jgi:hypothetical protein